MDSREHNKIIAFDTLFSTNHIQMMKILLPYLDNQSQKSMAVYIKFLELTYTIDYYQKNPYPVCGCMKQEPAPDLGKMCSELMPYCTEQEKKQIEQIANLFKGMEMYREFSKTMDMMKELMPDMDMGNLFGSFADGFGNIFGTEADSTPKAESCGTDADTDTGKESGSQTGFDIKKLMASLLTPEQKEIFDLLGGNQNEN